MDDIEEAFIAAAKLASTVVEMKESPVANCDKLKQRTLWVASVEIEVMGMLLQLQNSPRRLNVRSRIKQSAVRLQMPSRVKC